MKLIKNLILQMKSNPLNIFIFLTGYIVSIIGLSIILSDIITKKTIAFEYNGGISANTLEITVRNPKKIDFSNELASLNSNIAKKSYSQMVLKYVGDGNVSHKDGYYGVNGIYLNDGFDGSFPMLSGRFFKKNEILNKENIAVIGKNLKPICYKKGNDDYIKLYGEEFKIIGIIGREDKETLWDIEVFIPITSMAIKNEKFIEETSVILLTSEEGKQGEDIKKIKEKVESMDGFLIEIRELDNAKNIMSNIVSENKNSINLVMSIGFFSLINIMILSIYWVKGRKREIGIKKAFGINNFRISLMLFLEFLIISFIASFIAIIIQSFLSYFLLEIYNYKIYFYKENIIAIIIITIFTAMITSIIPILKCLKIQPAENIRKY